jgi:hypothetical protein
VEIMLKHFAPALVASLALSIPLSALTYPALPTATVDVTCCPPVTRTVAVHTATQLQAAFDNATLGDEIVLDAGTTYEGTFILKIPSGTSGWVTVRSSASSSLPAPGTRVSLADAPHMAKIMSPNYGDPGSYVSPAIGNNYNSTTYTDMGIHHYRFIGIEFATGLTSYNYHVMLIGPPRLGVPFSSATMPHDIIIDRCLIHGNDPLTTTFPDGTAQLNGSAVFDVANGAVVDSKLYNMWGVGTESQALTCSGGPGPRMIQNNEISGGTEGFLCGGGLLPYNDRITTDITVVHNYFNHPAAWQTSTPIVPYVKNLFELKVGKRVRLTDNVFENNWDRLGGGAQHGIPITLTPRPSEDSGYIANSPILLINEVSDIVVANNVVRKAGGFIAVGYYDSGCTEHGWTCVQSTRDLIANNLAIYDTSYADPGFRGAIGTNIMDGSIKRNTLLGSNSAGDIYGAWPGFFGDRPDCPYKFGANFEWSFNITDNGIQGSCSYDPANTLTSTSWDGTISVTSNLVVDLMDPVLSAWVAFGHGTQFAANKAAIGLSSDSLTLQPTSPYFGTGIGADLSCFNEAAVRAGTPSALCPLPPEVQAGTSSPGSQPGTVSCDLNSDGKINVLDVQLGTNQVLGYATCNSADLNGDGQCTVIDVQRIVSASLGAACHLGQ